MTFLASLPTRHLSAVICLVLALAAIRPSFLFADSLTIAESEEWAPYVHSVEIAEGGVLDFSRLLDAPAGKHGALRVTPAGHFEFEHRPGERVRFWGPNLTFGANYFENAEADRLAERFARSGYNTVRFHHYDRDLVRKGGPSWELDPEQLDRLDYLFAAMKKRGLYINIDLFSSRTFSPGELAAFGFADIPLTADNYKGLVPISEPAYESWARFARNLLTHRNPYTGLTWAEDPALIGICPVNEDQLFNRISHPVVRELYMKAFVESGAGPAEEAGLRSSPAWNRFIIETQVRANARMFAFLRGLGVKALLTGSNSEWTQSESFLREHYDYVDNHAYWDHPRFPGRPWQPPFAFHQNKATSDAAFVPRKLFATRIFGLPFTVTEFNFCRPNQYRAEGAVLMPAYAGLQDWDALYNFQYAMARESALEGGVDNYFALANDPIGLIADRVGALLFLRADISPARGAVVWAARPEEAFSDQWLRYPDTFTKLGLVTRLGSLTGQPAEVLAQADGTHNIAAAVIGQGQRFPRPDPLPAQTYLAAATLHTSLQRDGALPAGSINDEATRFTSDTGQIELRSDEGSVKVVTPRSELFVVPAGARIAGGLVSIEDNTADAAIGVVALDGKPLAETRRILVTHLTDALPLGATFTASDRKVLEHWGEGPHLVRRGNATVRLRLPAGGWKAWAVDATGARLRPVTLATAGGFPTLLVATITAEGTQLAYELAR